ncbi:MAG TPA: hypothetical protein VHA37_00850 [Candidatus Saccharimonadales bacterium]|nr:hypothetical protein [Candidatus Saccharimonadales bacterium]
MSTDIPEPGSIWIVNGQRVRIKSVEQTPTGWRATIRPADLDDLENVYCWPTNDLLDAPQLPPMFPKPSLCDQIHIRADEFMQLPIAASIYGKVTA